MAKTAFLLGGTGQIGRAAASAFMAAGWEVALASRGERPIAEELEELRHVQLDRADTDALRKALGGGVDVLVDIVAFEPEHGRQLVSFGDLARSLIVISTGSVYADDRGRSLDEATSEKEFPEFPGPITEQQATVRPGDATYSTKKVAIERIVLEQDRIPATVIRPWAIHGPGGSLSREWHFVKRALDGRKVVLLVDRGDGLFHTTSAENLAELIRLAAERPQTGVYNCGDPSPPRVREIARAIAAAMDHDWAELLLARDDPWQRGADAVGDTPWSALKPLVADMTAAEIDLAYRPVTTYEKAVHATCEWLVSATRGKEWQEVLASSAKYMSDAFDYAAEDELVRSLTGRHHHPEHDGESGRDARAVRGGR